MRKLLLLPALLCALTVSAHAGIDLSFEEILRGIGRGSSGSVGRILNNIALEKHVGEANAAKDALMGMFGARDLFGYELKGEISEFRVQQSKFYNAVSAAARADEGDVVDPRVKALVDWGRDTKVKVPGETFGEQIITTQQYWDLGR